MPLNTIHSLRQPEKKEFELLPEDIYEVEIVEIKDRERNVFEKPDEKEMVAAFTFRITEPGHWQGRKLWKDAPPVMWPGSGSGSPSTMYEIYSAVTGKKPSKDECDSIDIGEINALEGMSLRLVLKQKKNTKGELKNQISGYLPIKQYANDAEIEEPRSTVEYPL